MAPDHPEWKNKQPFKAVLENDEKLYANYVYIAPGRDGSEWLTEILAKNGLALKNNQVDIGVRVEVPNAVMSDINKHLYEAKLIFNAPTYSNIVRTFCSNPSGRVVIENHSGIMTVNGHAFRNDVEKQFNTDRTDTTIQLNGRLGMDYQVNKRTVAGILITGDMRHFTQSEQSNILSPPIQLFWCNQR